ncbi:Yip1 domain [Musa troglodytarum]|uniref:Protein YIP n=1 Tax=Musa troglodytarum TaxID=320322 RepID=A0A9E7GDD5_9LILI|nr:Yip1 domain [Musa troglodytarum]
MEEGYTSLPASHLLGSVPAVIAEDKTTSVASEAASSANLHLFPPSNGGYQAPGTPSGADEQTTSSWQGVFSISSYSSYFNVDTDVVVERIISSVYPMNDFYRKIDGNPDLYGPIWISATLMFMLAALGNVGTYVMEKRNDSSTTWTFDVNYVEWSACAIFGYVLAVPAAFYFLLQYFGFRTSLVRLWCMWGYSLFIFMPICMLLVVPVELFRWIIIILAGTASSWFIAVNLKACTQSSDLMILIVGAMVLQFALALFIKMFFFP